MWLLTRHDFGLATRARRIYWEVTIWCYYKISRFALLNIIMKLITLSSIVLTGHAASYRECLVKAGSITDCQKICDISSRCWFWVYKACVIKSCKIEMGQQLNGHLNAVQKSQTCSTYRSIRSTDYSPLNGLNGLLNDLERVWLFWTAFKWPFSCLPTSSV